MKPGSTASSGAERFPPLSPQEMTPEQKKVADAILKSRKNLEGPFDPWLRSPELADRLQSLGEYVRYKTDLPPALSEFVILITAREWRCQMEWHIHYPFALAAGIAPDLLAELAEGKRPARMSPDQTLVYDFSLALRRNKGQMPDALFDAVRSRFGDKALIDLIGINAYYDAAAMTLNAARVPLPAGVEPPLKQELP